MKVAVIGGGWAGLAAAVDLTESGIETTLFEAGRVLGGRARSIMVAGRQLDNGQHILLGAYSATLALMRRIGADPDQLFDRRPLQVIDNKGFRLALPKLPAPFNVAWGLLSAQGVDLGEKILTALWMDGIKRRRFQLDDDITVAQWLDRSGQTGKLRRHLWEPLCLAALNTSSIHASAQLFANVLRDSLGSSQREATDLLLPRITLGKVFPEPASLWLGAHGARIKLGTRVESITDEQDGFSIAGEHFSAAILATAPQHAFKLWPGMTSRFNFEPIATVYLQFGAEISLPFPLFNLFGRFGQWVVDRGNGMLAYVLSGHGDWEALEDDELIAALKSELAISGQVSWCKVIREQRATFSCTPGIVRPGCSTEHPRLFLAGDYTWAEYPATLEGAVRSGLAAACGVRRLR